MAEALENLNPRERAAFGVATRAARQVLRRRLRVLRLVRAAYERASDNETGIGRVQDDLFRLIRMSRAWARREYTVIPWRALLYTVAALVYFVNPIDLIPDALVGLGFLDDVAVVSAVVRALRKEIAAFVDWDEAQDRTRPKISARAA